MPRLILLALIALCVASTSPELQATNYPPSYALGQDTAAPKADKEEEIVYITKTGTKYHSASCRHLKKSSIPMEISKAKARYGACSVCGS